MISTPYSTWNPQWSATEHEIFRDFGFAAFAAQMLESSLITILLAGEYAGRIEFKKKDGIKSEDFLSEKTLGQLFRELKRGGIDGEIEAMLEDALEARNYLMHDFFVENSGKFVSEEGRGKMLEMLQNLRFRIGRTQIAFSQIREQLVEKIYGVSKEDLQRLYRERKEASQSGASGGPPHETI